MIIRIIILTKVLFTLRFVEFKNNMEPDLMIGQILSKRTNKKVHFPYNVFGLNNLTRIWNQNLEDELLCQKSALTYSDNLSKIFQKPSTAAWKRDY